MAYFFEVFFLDTAMVKTRRVMTNEIQIVYRPCFSMLVGFMSICTFFGTYIAFWYF